MSQHDSDLWHLTYWPIHQVCAVVRVCACVIVMFLGSGSSKNEGSSCKRSAALTVSFSLNACATTKVDQLRDPARQRQLLNSYAKWTCANSLIGLPSLLPALPSQGFLAIPVTLLIPLDFYLFSLSHFLAHFLSVSWPPLHSSSTSQTPPLPRVPLCRRELLSFLIKSEEGL